ncbi:hypothetical protein [Anaerocolumna xylanovorans]|uniref:Uncharacterized protein n=1 Tax=Anaerocolumna xylanovorans DSM 12503 TaxID=1121345 RepID=A0A1M7YM10_9FIRM|nr:hypothetical protein [Anaerocolumna xylanovorans]SHO53673.1 hypothetical protein SAMN02745217_04228 [Anaerocolumna xylanovorans DSM 12503]
MMLDKAEELIEKLEYYNLLCDVKQYKVTEKCQSNITYELNILTAELNDDVLIFDDFQYTLFDNAYVLSAIGINLLEDILFRENNIKLVFKNDAGYININVEI